MTCTTTPDDVFASLWQLAQCACATIEQEPPDLLLVLYKSGRLVEVAIETLWIATRPHPLPPRLAINLGTEKTRPFMDSDWPYHSMEWSEAEDAGRLVAWAQAQPQLLEPLQAQLAATLGHDQPPTRILVLDDVIHDGGTAFLSLGLLWKLYPDCETTLMAGLPPAWRQELGWHWLETTLLDTITKGANRYGVKGALTDEARKQLDQHWGALLTGIVDDGEQPLGWRPLTAATMPVNAFLPARGPLSPFLQLAPAMQQQVQAYIRAQLEQANAAPAQPLGRSPRLGWPQRVTLSWQEKLWAYAWPRATVSIEELLPICGVPPAELIRALDDYVGYDSMTRCETPAGPRYTITPRLGAVLCGTLLTTPHPTFAQLQWPETPPRTISQPAEYAYTNPAAAGAPLLLLLSSSAYAAVNLPVMAVHPATLEDDLLAALIQQAAMERPPVATPEPPQQKQIHAGWAYLNDVCGLRYVLYHQQEPTLPFVLDTTIPIAERAERLAQLAIASVTAETYRAGTDGIRYLATAMQLSIETPLTPHYEQAILRLTSAADLEEARDWVLAQKC